jgi:hypothetical protein
MTRDELRAAWAKWAHRNDISGSVDTVDTLAEARVRDRLMAWDVQLATPEEIDAHIAAAPGMWMAAGLIELFRLAADPEQMSREVTLFEGAAADWLMRQSLNAGPAVMMGRRFPNGS